MELLLWTALFTPLASSLIILCFSNILPRKVVEFLGPGSILGAFLLFSYFLYREQFFETTLFTWIPIPGFTTNFSLHLDHLSLLMTLIVTGVGFLIHAYSVGYMDHDTDIARYFSVMNFFIFSMLLLVLAAELLLFFVGWEGVGLASYLLIGFWYERPAAQKAAKKAFVVNRIGDLGLLLGILLTFSLFGTGNIEEVSQRVGTEFAVGAPVIALLSFLYFWGAIGKSAQIPLHVWLPDAMEGPTPVSALIHAATMVTAGVYLVVRMHSVFMMSPDILNLVTAVGGITALFAALCAVSQKDLKRVLAYSTVSQLGLMFLACGAGAYFAAMFHLTTHAFVKALLFLSAGNVIHMMHGTTEMEKMGGLSSVFSKTNILFLIGVLSMAGIPPLAIFFSKDLILEEEFRSGCKLCYIVGLIISLLTAFYLTRAYFLTFRGKSEIDSSLKEAPAVMIVPVAVLAVLSIVGGLLGFALDKPPILMQFLEQDSKAFASDELRFGFTISAETWISIAVAVLGVSLGAVVYSRFKERLGKTFQFFLKAFYINELYHALLVVPARALSNAIARFFEPKLYDASIDAPARITNEAASSLQKLQSGLIRSYIAWVVCGAALLILFLSFEGIS